MTEWRHIKRFNPVGPDYPEAGRDYVLRSEAEDRIEAAEANLRAVGELPSFELDAPAEGRAVLLDDIKALLKGPANE